MLCKNCEHYLETSSELAGPYYRRCGKGVPLRDDITKCSWYKPKSVYRLFDRFWERDENGEWESPSGQYYQIDDAGVITAHKYVNGEKVPVKQDPTKNIGFSK